MHTALCIQNNRDHLRIDAGGPTEDGKYVGWIMLDVERWHPLLNTEPVFDSAEAAKEHMKALVDEICSMDLLAEAPPLVRAAMEELKGGDS